MQWRDAGQLIKEVADQIIFDTKNTKNKRRAAIASLFGYTSGSDADGEPTEFILGITPRASGTRNAPECKIWVGIVRVRSDPNIIKLKQHVAAYFTKTKKLKVNDIIIERLQKPFYAYTSVLPNPHSCKVHQSVCSYPAPGTWVAVDNSHGSLMCYAKKSDGNDDRLFAITAAHALGVEEQLVGDEVYQPDSYSLNNYVFGKVAEVRPPNPKNAARPVDAAAIEVTSSNYSKSEIIGSKGQLQLKHPSNDERYVYTGETVATDGGGNGFQLGTVTAINIHGRLRIKQDGKIRATVPIESGIMVAGAGNKFSSQGDSGAPVFDPDTGELLGMIVGGQSSSDTPGDTIYLPVTLVLNSLSMKVEI